MANGEDNCSLVDKVSVIKCHKVTFCNIQIWFVRMLNNHSSSQGGPQRKCSLLPTFAFEYTGFSLQVNLCFCITWTMNILKQSFESLNYILSFFGITASRRPVCYIRMRKFQQPLKTSMLCSQVLYWQHTSLARTCYFLAEIFFLFF